MIPYLLANGFIESEEYYSRDGERRFYYGKGVFMDEICETIHPITVIVAEIKNFLVVDHSTFIYGQRTQVPMDIDRFKFVLKQMKDVA
jgi:hypothetical protein